VTVPHAPEFRTVPGPAADLPVAAPEGAVHPEQACPITPVMDIVFSRWTTPILWALHRFGRQRFVELERRIGIITPKVLTQRLRQLERDGLVVRTYHQEVPPRVEYEISELGRSLAPLFAALADWSQVNLDRVEQARQAFDAAQAAAASRRR
jgi:DNA-binding HxlR family transcriptional regulator